MLDFFIMGLAATLSSHVCCCGLRTSRREVPFTIELNKMDIKAKRHPPILETFAIRNHLAFLFSRKILKSRYFLKKTITICGLLTSSTSTFMSYSSIFFFHWRRYSNVDASAIKELLPFTTRLEITESLTCNSFNGRFRSFEWMKRFAKFFHVNGRSKSAEFSI